MFQCYKKFLLPCIVFIITLQLPQLLVAQENQRYTGNHKIGSYYGKADYQYFISEQDTILDGPFKLQRSNLEALLEKEDASFLFQGSFKKGIADGLWKFQFGEFKSDSKTEVVDYEYRVRVTGIQDEGIGSIVDGKPNGSWKYEVNQIVDSKLDKALFKSNITFENGVPQRNFQMENEKAVLVGRFLRNGLAHDEWSSYDLEAIENTESWFFEEGLLKKIQIVEEGRTKNITVFTGHEDSFEIINIDKSYFRIIQSFLATQGISFSLNKGLPNLISTNENYYNKIDTLLNLVGSAEFKAQFKVQVPYFAIDSLESSEIRQITADYSEAILKAERLLNNSQLNILKRSDTDALFYYKSLENITENFLTPLKPFVELGNNNTLQFLNRSELIKQLWKNGKPSKEITVTLDSLTKAKSFVLNNADEFNFDGNSINSVSEVVRYAKNSITEIQNKLSAQLTSEERAQALILLEEDLIKQNESLGKLIANTKDSLNPKEQNALKNIEQLAENSLGKYATSNNPQSKLEYGQSIASCFDKLLTLTNKISDLPQQKRIINSLYQDAIWNPFMATVMDEEVKKRITTAYFKNLLPFFMQQLNDKVTCETVEVVLSQLNEVHLQMEQLRTVDTKKLERKLRKEEDPKEIMKLFSEHLTAKAK